jgi:hypothetical protein
MGSNLHGRMISRKLNLPYQYFSLESPVREGWAWILGFARTWLLVEDCYIPKCKAVGFGACAMRTKLPTYYVPVLWM